MVLGDGGQNLVADGQRALTRTDAQLAAQRRVHPLELPQRRTMVARLDVLRHQRDVGLLVGRVLDEQVLPAPRQA